MKNLFNRKVVILFSIITVLVLGVGITLFSVLGATEETSASEEPKEVETTNVKTKEVKEPKEDSSDKKEEPKVKEEKEEEKKEPKEVKTEAKKEEVSKTTTETANSNNEKTSEKKVESAKASEPKKTETKPTVKKEKKINETTVTHKAYETTDNLNLRKGPSTDYSRITTIPKGKKVTHIATSGSWYKVEYGNYTGYVSSAYLKEPSKATTKPKDTSSSSKDVAKPTYIQGIIIANKKYALPSNYAPGESKEAREAFNKMAAASKKEGIGLSAFSTYRSYETQKSTYDYWVSKDGQAAADRYSARPGTSEHQTGLAFDIVQEGKYDTRFEESDGTRWLAKNAHKYGFILRYPQGKEHITGYMYEPWHFRYLGVETATKVYNSGLTLEEYLGIQ